jgi:hypothetical protein
MGGLMSSKGFVLFTTVNHPYLNLASVAVKSLLRFSKHDVFVVGINGKIPWKHDRILTESVSLSKPNFENICYLKTQSSLLSPFHQSVQMDGDMIASPSIDNVFDLERSKSPFPKGSLHPFDPVNQLGLMKLLGVTAKTQPYVHATYLYDRTSIPFLEEVAEIERWILKRRFFGIGYSPPNFDETILNVALWKHGAYDAFIETYDPYFEGFLNPKGNRTMREIFGFPVYRHISHGQKCPTCASSTLARLEQLHLQGKWSNSADIGSDWGTPHSSHQSGTLELDHSELL